MRALNGQERAARDAIAARHAATPERGSGGADAWLRIAERRVALTVRALDRRDLGTGNLDRPRLRFDRVVKSVASRLQAGLGEAVPRGLAVVVTITAPIRLAARTAAELEERVRTLLRRPSPGRSFEGEIRGNRVAARLLADPAGRAPRVMTFVHNPGTEARVLSGMVRALLALPDAAAGSARRSREERWLVAACAAGGSHLEALRHVDSLLRPPPGFARRFLVFGDGQVGELAGG